VIPPPIVESLASWKNESIPASEASIARHWLLLAEAELVQINEEIRVLEARRAALLFSADVCQVAVAPHKTLPTDVLCEIFHWVALGPANITSIVCGRPEPRLIICRVCSRWRSIALDMHELWSDSQSALTHHGRSLELMDLWLSRSGQYPLTLTIGDGHYPDSIFPHPDFIQQLVRCAHRIRTLSFTRGIPSLYPMLMALLDTLIVDAEDHYRVAHTSVILLLGAPRLRSVKFRNFRSNDPECLMSPEITWRQLTEISFELMPLPIPQYYHILSQCVALTTASLGIYQNGLTAPLPTSHQTITVPSLRKLSLSGASLSNSGAFLASFFLPSLVDLSLFGWENRGSDEHHVYPVVTFPALERLWIDRPNGGSVLELVQWFQACSSAAVVFLPNSELSNPLLTQIADGSLLPSLKMLVLRRCEVATLIPTLLARQSSPDHSTIAEVGLYVAPHMQQHYAHDLIRYVVISTCQRSLKKSSRSEIPELTVVNVFVKVLAMEEYRDIEKLAPGQVQFYPLTSVHL
jgi:hypothetical protein